MADALKVVPTTDEIETGVKNAPAIAEGLADVLADTYRLIFKTHAYHWNVTGPTFYSVHKLTDDQYANMFDAADELAERIRALGQLAPFRMNDIMNRSHIEDQEKLPNAGEMVEELASDHEKLARRLHNLIELSGEHSDPVTEDLATERSAFHEEAAWMLRAIAAS
ncbi:MAG: Dps family protein [Paracoccaceae bacterium]